MGKRGPAPMPTAMKLLHGERRSSRLNLAEPRPRPALPKRPADLSPAAAVVWRRVIREVGATGVIAAADTDILRCYCEAVARYQVVASALEQSTPLVRGARSGELVKNPLHQLVRDNADLVRAFGGELGLTPASRTRLTGTGQREHDPVADFLDGRRRA